MKIIITASASSLDQPFSPRFGRAEYFILVDSQTMAWEAYPNPAVEVAGGAGPHAVQFLADLGAEAVISGRYGPSAFTALQAAGIQPYIAEGGTVREVVNQFDAGMLPSPEAASGPGLHGRG